jgi:PncC family amidohydrolase
MADDTRELVEALATECARLGYTLAVAESCTGGSLAAAITDIPGVSAFFVGGVVSYANEVKQDLLSVPATILSDHGAVSAQTARAMASGVRERLGADVGISVTGIAGPGGATPGKPVGLVYVGVATPKEDNVRRDIWHGDRSEVRASSVRGALELALRMLANVSTPNH